MIGQEIQLLFWKEVRQLTRNTAAMLSSLFMPAVLVVLAPILALLASRTQPYRELRVPPLTASLPGFDVVRDGQGYFLYVTIPVLFVLAALLTPILSATHTLIVERERRSLELLMALPVVVGDILTAKLAANLATAVATIVPMFLVDAVVILTLTGAGMAYVVGSLFLLLTTLVASAGASLLMALLSRDLRTATQLGGMLSVPPLLITGLCIVFVPGLGRFAVLGLLMLALGCGALYSGLRWLTSERYVA
ncbi:MAG TPA: ABC transporter permease [Candidatus Dormibacteraeota bacterium]|nr:ABC transporter permease [Candidatus Dormibacteraeota bacterium]